MRSMKRILSTIGIGLGFLYAYQKGYTHGRNAAESQSDTKEDPIEVEVDPSEDDDTDNSGIECKDDSCEETFDSERGMEIHYGQMHKED